MAGCEFMRHFRGHQTQQSPKHQILVLPGHLCCLSVFGSSATLPKPYAGLRKIKSFATCFYGSLLRRHIPRNVQIPTNVAPDVPGLANHSRLIYICIPLLTSKSCQMPQVVDRLSDTLPVLIDHETWEETAEEVDDLMVGDAEVG